MRAVLWHGKHDLRVDTALDLAKQKLLPTMDRAHALRMAIMAVRKGGRVSVSMAALPINSRWARSWRRL